MPERLLRRAVGSFLLLFCLGTFAAPHRHLNPIADLVTDGQSDSGDVLVVPPSRLGGRGPVWTVGTIVDDDPCLACFWHDVTASVAAIFAFCFVALALANVSAASAVLLPLPVLSSPLNRGPPIPLFAH